MKLYRSSSLTTKKIDRIINPQPVSLVEIFFGRPLVAIAFLFFVFFNLFIFFSVSLVALLFAQRAYYSKEGKIETMQIKCWKKITELEVRLIYVVLAVLIIPAIHPFILMIALWFGAAIVWHIFWKEGSLRNCSNEFSINSEGCKRKII